MAQDRIIDMSQDNCPTCGLEMKWIKPGISQKTGRPYNGFWSCPNRCPKAQSFNDLPQKTIEPPQKPLTFSPNEMIKYLGVLRGDIKRLEIKIDELLKVSVIYPKDLEKNEETFTPEETSDEQL